jgi:phosphoribosyl 1,2-cyclic phosphodiesterase
MEFKAYHSGSSGNLYLAKSEHGSLLIEAGIPIKRIKKALDYNLSSIDGCLVSHSHMDHMQAVPDLLKAGIDCFMSQQTAEATKADNHRLHVVEPLKQFEISRWTAIAFPTQHDVDGSLGFIVSDGNDKLLFATDTFYVHHRFVGLTHIVVECNYSKATLSQSLNPIRKKRLYKSHFSLENVKKFLSANDMNRAREIHLIHLSRENADPDYFKKEIEKLTGVPTYIAPW